MFHPELNTTNTVSFHDSWLLIDSALGQKLLKPPIWSHCLLVACRENEIHIGPTENRITAQIGPNEQMRSGRVTITSARTAECRMQFTSTSMESN